MSEQHSIVKYPRHWAMCGTDVDNVDLNTYDFPLMWQPKLNGVRAMWTGTKLVSRQRLIWPAHVLPSLHVKLETWSREHPGHPPLDGELYNHKIPFQTMAGIVQIHQKVASSREHEVDLHVFDCVTNARTDIRQSYLKNQYPQWVPVGLIKDKADIDLWLNRAIECGYEGIMLRTPGSTYQVGRSADLIKIKPWHIIPAKIVAFTEGCGKYYGMLGALVVVSNNHMFKVSGGISDDYRDKIWRHQKDWKNRNILVSYRELSLEGIPLKAQVNDLNPSNP